MKTLPRSMKILDAKAEALDLIEKLGLKIDARQKRADASGDFRGRNTISDAELSFAAQIAASGALDAEALEKLDQRVFGRSLSLFYSRERLAMAKMAHGLAAKNGIYFPIDKVYARGQYFIDHSAVKPREFIDLMKYFQKTIANRKIVLLNPREASGLLWQAMFKIGTGTILGKAYTHKQKVDVSYEILKATEAFEARVGIESLPKDAAESYYSMLRDFAVKAPMEIIFTTDGKAIKPATAKLADPDELSPAESLGLARAVMDALNPRQMKR